MRIGIIGAGFIGRAVAKLATTRGFEVMISNSRGPKSLMSTAASIGCRVGTAKDASEFGDVVLVAVPFSNILELSPQPLAGKIVMDANNYYPQRDGAIDALDKYATTTSEMLANHLQGAHVVKAFNAILERDIIKDADAADRRALPIAGDDAHAKKVVTDLLNALGYDAVDAGRLSEGWRFERARPAYCVPFDREGLIHALAAADTSVPEGSWRKDH